MLETQHLRRLSRRAHTLVRPYRHVRLFAGLLLLLPACDTLSPPTLTPTPPLSGPTLEASPVIRPYLPTELPQGYVSSGQNDPTAAALPRDSDLPPLPVGTVVPGAGQQVVEITMADGTFLSGDLYGTGTARVPGVLVLATDRTMWGAFAAEAEAAGFTVLVIEVRDPASVDDFEVMLEAFTEVGTVDPARVGVVGAAEMADLALMGCTANRLCDTVILLSPLQQDAALRALPLYNPRPLMVVASEDDADSYAAAQAVQGAVTGEVLFQSFTSAGRGTAMLQARPDLADLMVTWLTRQLVER